jgi:hypothetical protein
VSTSSGESLRGDPSTSLRMTQKSRPDLCRKETERGKEGNRFAHREYSGQAPIFRLRGGPASLSPEENWRSEVAPNLWQPNP